MSHSTHPKTRSLVALAAATLLAGTLPRTAIGQDEGGLYIANSQFSFEEAARQALARSPEGQRFFVLALPPNTRALTTAASRSTASVRDHVVARGGVLYVCQRDIDDGSVDVDKLVPGVVAVRGFPPPGSDAIPPGERYFPNEDRATLPVNNVTLRQLRQACS